MAKFNVKDLSPKMDGRFYYGWVMLFMGFICMFIAYVIKANCTSLFYTPICEEFGVSRTVYAQTNTTMTVCMLIGSAYIGKIMTKYKMKYVLPAFTVVICITYLLMSRSNAMWQLLVLNGIQGFMWAGMTNLRALECYGSEATYSNVDGLSQLTQLETIRLPIRVYGQGASPYDIQGLSGLTKLTHLDIPCGIKDLTPLSSLTDLQFLSARNGGGISGSDTSLEPLRSLTDLTELALSLDTYQDHEITVDLSPLADLTNLQTLSISAQNSSWDPPIPSLSNLSALANLKDLRTLELRFSNVTDISPLRELTNLQSVSIYDSGRYTVSDWSPVEHVPVVNKNS